MVVLWEGWSVEHPAPDIAANAWNPLLAHLHRRTYTKGHWRLGHRIRHCDHHPSLLDVHFKGDDVDSRRSESEPECVA